ncbi:MAG: transposase [Rikenellaceae bacterium]
MKKKELEPTLAFTEYSFINEHREVFSRSELGLFHTLIPFDQLEKQFSQPRQHRQEKGRHSIFSMRGKIALMILKSKYNLSDKSLIERLNTDVAFQIFCDIHISPKSPLVDFKIVSRIRCELSKKLDIMEFQKIIANALKSYISSNDLLISMSDATCYESHLRFPTNQKLLWECVENNYKLLVCLSHELGLRTPRTKYLDVSAAYNSFAKTRKKSHKKKRRISRRLLPLLKKLILEIKQLINNKHIKLSRKDAQRFKISEKILSQQTKLFNGEKIENRIVSISKPYIRPIVRGKETKAVEFGAKVNSIQVGGFNFIEHIDFKAFHEGIRVPECINLHKILFHRKPLFFAGDAIYATNANRTYCRLNHITTNFVPKGRLPQKDKEFKVIRKSLNKARSTVLEGSFGTEKEHYSLRKVKARTKKTEILWIVFGIHTANFARVAARLFRADSKVIKAA